MSVFLINGKVAAQGWQWSAFGTGPQTSISQAVATDKYGNKFVAGAYLGDTLNVGSFILSNAGDQNAYVIKYSPSGDVVWAKRFGGMYKDGATALATDSAGNVYVAGYFTSAQLRFDTIIIGNFYQNYVEGGISTPDAFLAKIDSSGHCVWAKGIGGFGSEMINSVCVGPYGDVTVCGTFNSDSLILGPDTLFTAGAYDIFVVRYNTAGAIQWHAHAGGTHSDGAYAVTTDTADNLYLAGNFASATLSFGSTVLSNTSGVNHVFITKYSRTGVVQWARSAGSDKDALATSVVTDRYGYPYLAGTFSSSSFSFGADSLYNTTGFGNMFLVKLTLSGNLLWQKGAAIHDNIFPQALACDTSGYLYVAGYFSSPTATLGSTIVSNSDASGYADIFLAKYNNGGDVAWVATAGGPNDDVVYSLATDTYGNIYVSGYFAGPDFYLDLLDDTSSQGTDFFIARFNEQKMAVPENTIPETGIRVFPVPAADEINIVTTTGTIYNLTIINEVGQTVFSDNATIATNQRHINTRGLSEGYYTVVVTDNRHLTSRHGFMIVRH